MFKNTFLTLAFLILLTPQFSYAAPVRSAERSVLLEQISVLTKEVERLRALLAQKQDNTYRFATFTPSTAEIRYDVTNGVLTRGRGVPNATHEALFKQFKEIIGSEAASRYMSEFRVGHVRDATLDDYIEGYIKLIPEDDTWMLSLKRDGTKPVSKLEHELFEELFIHEYGHVVLYYEEAFSNTFTNRFWDYATYRASERTKGIYEREGYGGLEDAHRGYRDEFVSGYAILNPEEDMAETFVAFIEGEYPTGSDTFDNKVRFFYTNATMVSVREEIRDNIGLE